MEKTMKKQFDEEPPPAIGVPYPQQAYYAAPNPHQSGMVPPNAVYGDPKGIPLTQTMFRDTPAPFDCAYCGSSGLTLVRCGSRQRRLGERLIDMRPMDEFLTQLKPSPWRC